MMDREARRLERMVLGHVIELVARTEIADVAIAIIAHRLLDVSNADWRCQYLCN